MTMKKEARLEVIMNTATFTAIPVNTATLVQRRGVVGTLCHTGNFER